MYISYTHKNIQAFGLTKNPSKMFQFPKKADCMYTGGQKYVDYLHSH